MIAIQAPEQNKTLYQEYEDPKELNYICAVKNLSSIIDRGLLSHKRAHALGNISDLSNDEVQYRRKSTIPPNQQRKENSKRDLNLY